MNFNYAIDLLGLAIAIALMFSERRNKITGNLDQKMFRLLLHSISAVFILDIPAWMLIGKEFAGATQLSYILNTAYYIAQIVYCFLWLIFADCWNHVRPEKLKKRVILYSVPAIIEIIVTLTNPFTNWVFSIDSYNVYLRGSLYYINLIPYAFYILYAVLITFFTWLKSKDVAQKRQSLSFLAYMILPIIGTALQMFNYGVSLLWPFTVMSLIMIYLNVQQQNVMMGQIAEARVEQELSHAQIAIMLSQIQPHFLYNALGSIRELYKTNPQAADTAMVEFSQFLRGNMDSLKTDKAIAFEQELNHTRNYLDIEKIRFEERLNIVYDLKTTDFHIPTLTLQPIVENAVRYGVTKQKAGGTVIIRTEETNDNILVSVSDDGVGFDPMLPPTDGRTHIGIQNVRDRLARMCGGSLAISSTPDVGTTVVITIPKEVKKC